MYKFVADMRIAEYGMFLFQFDYVRNWTTYYRDVLFDVLAQHYGLETNWLDITNDFNVALFFATYYYDQTKNQWEPLTKDMTKRSESTKCGMIFHIGTQHLEKSDKKILINDILPIGFQPFMRCHMQNGYGIKMIDEYPLQEDFTFEKLRFRHSEKLSNNIYKLMQQGRLIYPHEGLLNLMDIIESIRQGSNFTEEAFDYAFENNSYFTDKDKCRKILTETAIYGNERIIIGDTHPYQLSRQRRRNLDRKYKDFSIEREYEIKLMTRKTAYGR